MRLGAIDKPFPVLLAPMAGVTDLPFRLLCRRMGCDMTYTEMVSAKGLYYQNARTKELLMTAEEERPCAVQLFGSNPAIMADMARRIEAEYQGEIALIDINMGCPAPKITNNGEGSALMRDEPLAARIIASVASAVRLPVTVKFRRGWDEGHQNYLSFARMAQDSGAAAVALHGRTRAQGYSGKADWGCITEVKAALRIPVLGNGDVYSAADALHMRAQTGCDGVLIARGAQGNPFLFREIGAALRAETVTPPSLEERIETALMHARMQVEYRGRHGVIEMRKHIAWYIKGEKGAARLRVQVNACTTLAELEALLCGYAEAQARHGEMPPNLLDK